MTYYLNDIWICSSNFFSKFRKQISTNFLSLFLFLGGTAGAVSRIGGSIGKGLAFLTFDDEYQKKRQEGLNKKPANIGEGFARGGKDLFMGFFHGATGIVRQPIRGAQREGVEGFFKGIDSIWI